MLPTADDPWNQKSVLHLPNLVESPWPAQHRYLLGWPSSALWTSADIHGKPTVHYRLTFRLSTSTFPLSPIILDISHLQITYYISKKKLDLEWEKHYTRSISFLCDSWRMNFNYFFKDWRRTTIGEVSYETFKETNNKEGKRMKTKKDTYTYMVNSRYILGQCYSRVFLLQS